MPHSETPCVLVVAPDYGQPSPPNYAQLATLCDAIESQAPTLRLRYMGHPSRVSLGDLLSGGKGDVGLVVLYLAFDGAGCPLLCSETGCKAIPVTTTWLAEVCGQGPQPMVLLVSRGEGDSGQLLSALMEQELTVLSATDDASGQALTALFTELLSGGTADEAAGSAAGVDCLRLGENRFIGSSLVQGSGVSKVVAFPGAELTPAWRRLPEMPRPGGLPLSAHDPLVGRDLMRARLCGELRRCERGLVWLYGYEGMGKTHLAVASGRWLTRTGRFEQVIYTSFASGGMDEWAIYDLGKALIGRGFDPAGAAAREQVIEALNETATLVIWDEIDALGSQGRWPLAAEAWHALAELAQAVGSAGQSRLLVISDTLDLPPNAADLGEIGLPLQVGGLDSFEGQALLGSGPDDAAAERLVDALGGQPMALRILRPLVADRDCETVYAGLCEIMPGLASGDGRLRNQGLTAAITYLLDSLPEERRLSLARMGLLCGGGLQPMALGVAHLDAEAWLPIRERLLASGLLVEEAIPGFKVAYLRLHSAFLRQMDRRIVAATRLEATIEYYGRFLGISQWMGQMESRSADLVRFMAHQDLGNFRATLAAMLADNKLTLATGYVQRLDHYCGLVGLSGERERMREMMAGAAQKALPAEGPLARPGVQFLLSQAEQLLGAGRLQQAMVMLQPFSQRIMADESLSYQGAEAALDRATAMHLLSRGMIPMGRPDMVGGMLSQAIKLLEEHQQDDIVARRLMAVRQDLADMLAGAGQADGAQEQYELSMALAERLAERETQAGLCRRMGALASARGEGDQAQALFDRALGLYEGVDDTNSMIGVLQQMAAMLRQGQEPGKAMGHLRRALSLAESSGADLEAAQIQVALGQMAQQDGRLDEARDLLQQAIATYNENKARGPLMGAEMALAELLLVEGSLLEARAHAEAARSAAEGINSERVPWGIYGLLQRIAEAEGNDDAERMWRLRAQEAFGLSREAEGMRRHWAPLIESVSASCRGQALDMQTVEMVEKLEEASEWQSLAETIWRILNGERGEALYAEADYVDALVIRSILYAVEHPPEPEEDEAGQS